MLKRILCVFPLIIISLLIFTFSSHSAKVSSEISRNITNSTISTIVSDENGEKTFEATVFLILFESHLRKFAHVVLFFALGMSALLFFDISLQADKYHLLVYLIVFSVLFAFLDEMHQYFVPGRAMLAMDILIDTASAVLSYKLYSTLKRKTTK